MSEAWQRSWQPTIESIGRSPATDTVVWGADPVERGAIRRYVEPLEFDCELHHSGDVARRYGFADLVAPYSSAFTWALPPLWVPGRQLFDSTERDAQPGGSSLSLLRDGFPPEATGYFVTDVAVDFVRPPVAGDRLGRREGPLLAVSLKQTRVGRGAFLTRQSEIVDAQLQTVAVLRSGSFVYEPMGRGPGGEPGPAVPAAPLDWATGPAALDVDQQRVGTDVREGELLAPTRFPLPVCRLIMAAASNRDFNGIHHNSEFARSTGATEMYANVMLLMGMWERAARGYIGNAGTIKAISGFRMHSFNTAGEVITVRGRVHRVLELADETTVELAMWSENGHGISVGPGTVTVGLPSRRRAVSQPPTARLVVPAARRDPARLPSSVATSGERATKPAIT
jgi:acyl dehydratase